MISPAAATVSDWRRAELREYLTGPYRTRRLDRELAGALIERATRVDTETAPAGALFSPFPVRESSDLLAILVHPDLTVDELADCYRLVHRRLDVAPGPDHPDRVAGRVVSVPWSGLRHVLAAIGSHPTCSLAVLASMTARDAMTTLRSAPARPLLAPHLGSDEHALRTVVGYLTDMLVGHTAPFSGVLDRVRAEFDTTTPGWELLASIGLADTSPNPYVPFAERLAATTAALRAAPPAVVTLAASLASAGATAPLADLLAAASLIEHQES
jgi:hypothetical protein